MPSAAPGYAPDLEKYLKSLKGQPLEASMEKLVSLLKRRQIRGSEPCAVATAHILLQVVARSKWQDVDGLLDKVSAAGRRLVEAQPRELVVANIVRRVLALIRDEAAEDRNEPSSEAQSEAPLSPTTDAGPPPSWSPPPAAAAMTAAMTRQNSAGDAAPPVRAGLLPSYSSANLPKSLFHLLSASPPTADAAAGSGPSSFRNSGTSTPTGRGGGAQANGQMHTLRSEVIDGIEEILDEIGQVDDQIAAQAEVQIRPGDHVLVHQPSATVERFVLRAALKRRFTVLVAEPPPRRADDGARAAAAAAFRRKLAAAGVTAISIQSGALTAYMSRVDKVILGARAVVANGGVVGEAGAATVARAAREAGSAVVALAGVYRLSPETPFDEAALIEWDGPGAFVSFADGPLVAGVEVRGAATELVPPALVDTYVTNLGTHSRDHLASLIADHYRQEDADFQLCGGGDG